MEEIKKGLIVEFKDKSPNPKTGLSHENAYQVIGTCFMKDPTSREWLPAVIYKGGDEVYVRELNEFIEKFQIKTS